MSRNYDNWERLVAAVMKREQIWQLCHQDSISTISASDDYSSDLELGLPVSLGNFCLTDTFEFVRSLPQSRRNFRTELVRLQQDLQVSDQLCYYSQGSVYDMFQGYGARPNWESRARIAVGAARGIAHIHAQCGGKLAHGNIKSSNIFVNSQQYGCVSDFGRSEHELESPGAQKSDVYSFGMLLLELVIGRSVVQSHYIVNRLRLSEPDTFDFSGFCLFVDEIDFEESKLEKFPFVDKSIGSSPSVQQDLRKTLGVAKRCLAELPQDRPTMSQVVFQLEKKGDLSVVKTEQIHQHPISHHKSGGKKQIWDIILQFRRRRIRNRS